MPPEPLARMIDIDKDYQMGEVTVHALRDLNLQIQEGEFLVLLGPSGSGKTTTLNLLGGLDRPTRGQVVVQGQEITGFDQGRLTEYRRNQVGFIFQLFNLIPTLTAQENVEFALALNAGGEEPQDQALELLEQVGLAERAAHFPAQLSAGEQQRVAIARALANQPPLLLCDEPTGDLDVDTGRQVLRVIQSLNREEGATVVLVTHNRAIAPMANRVVHLSAGTIDHIEEQSAPVSAEDVGW